MSQPLPRNRKALALHPEVSARIAKCRDLLEHKIETREIMYGCTRGSAIKILFKVHSDPIIPVTPARDLSPTR